MARSNMLLGCRAIEFGIQSRICLGTLRALAALRSWYRGALTGDGQTVGATGTSRGWAFFFPVVFLSFRASGSGDPGAAVTLSLWIQAEEIGMLLLKLGLSGIEGRSPSERGFCLRANVYPVRIGMADGATIGSR